MEISHIQEENKGEFRIGTAEERYAAMTYSKAGDSLIIIDHTEVYPGFQGKGYGLFLLEELIKYVREKEIKVIPLCPFAAAQFKKNPAFQDVLK